MSKIHSSIWLSEQTTAKVKTLMRLLSRRGQSEIKRELIEWALEQPYWLEKLKGDTNG